MKAQHAANKLGHCTRVLDIKKIVKIRKNVMTAFQHTRVYYNFTIFLKARTATSNE